jgi:hypothetical protein
MENSYVAGDMSHTADSVGLVTMSGGKIYPTWQRHY